jgi:hypothetical protein
MGEETPASTDVISAAVEMAVIAQAIDAAHDQSLRVRFIYSLWG